MVFDVSRFPDQERAILRRACIEFPDHEFSRLFADRRAGHVLYGVLRDKKRALGDIFVKAALADSAKAALRREVKAYEALGKHDFLPKYYGVLEAGDCVALLIESPQGAHWPPPWSAENVERIQKTLEGVSCSVAPELDTPISAFEGMLSGWQRLEREERLRLAEDRLQLAPGTLQRNIRHLIALSEQALQPSGELLHFDVRSDNVCFRANGAPLLLDWSWWCRGQVGNQLAAWGASLSRETNQDVWTIGLDVRPEHVALVAGYFAQYFGIPYEGASHVRPLQARQAEIAVGWLQHLGVI